MVRIVTKTALAAVPTVLILVLLVSILVRLIPGTAIDVMLSDSGANAGSRTELTHQLGLDRSVLEQFAIYLRDVLTGSFGHSLYDGKPVRELIMARAIPTIELSALALAVSMVVGVAIGVVSAIKRGSRLDYVLRLFANTSLGVPNFVIATAIVLLPAYFFAWSPPLRYIRFTDDPFGNLTFFIAPTFTLGLALAGSVARLTRTAMLEVMYEDYVRTARAKGLAESTVILRHVLRNALLPVLTLLGLQVAALMSGVVIIEQVFSIPGMGQLLLREIAQRDYPVVQGITLLSGVIVILVNMAVEVSYGFANPRLRA